MAGQAQSQTNKTSDKKEFPTSFSAEVAEKLSAPFENIRWRVQSTVKGKDGKFYGIYFAYIDSRQAADRLNDVIGNGNWNFTWQELPVSVEKYKKAAVNDYTGKEKHPEKIVEDHKFVVRGRLEIFGTIREDVGYPNSDEDKEPYKSAVSDALKRCAVQFGLGRFLYSLGTKLIEIDEKTKKPVRPEDLKKLENMFKSA